MKLVRALSFLLSCLIVASNVFAATTNNTASFYGGDVTISYSGRSFDGTNTTFSYQVCRPRNSSEIDLESIILGVSGCQPILELVNCSEQSCVINSDQKTSVFGVVYDPAPFIEIEQCKTLSYTLAGNISEVDNISIGVATTYCGGEDECEAVANITGPGCAVVIPSPTPTPTPTISACNLGGPYQVGCSDSRVSVVISPTQIPAGSGKWSSNCPNEQFNLKDMLKPVISFDAFNSSNIPNTCTVVLNMTDNLERTFSCSAQINVSPCTFDCAAKLNGTSTFDKCGVCNGDNKSCINCKDFSNREAQLLLDGQALDQFLVARASTIAVNNSNGSRNSITKANKLLILVQGLYQLQWKNVWVNIPGVSRSCTASSPCVFVSAEPQIADYNSRALEMRNISKLILNSFPSGSRYAKKKQKLLNKINQAYTNAVNATGLLPKTSSVCE
jgi:hypothetical protein